MRMQSRSRRFRHPPRHLRQTTLLSLFLASLSPTAAQTGPPRLDTIRAGRFDMGKMWTFENPPQEYFSTTYGFRADQGWFDAARMAALRISGCSAAFVSPHGLVVTNHHCVRANIVQASRPGERLLDEGFLAATPAQERSMPGFWVDQLIGAEDVSEEVLGAMDRAPSPEEREQARRQAVSGIQQRLAARHSQSEGQVRVDVVALYNGGRYSAYTYRRYTDVRLVAAPELAVAHFGGDYDNFTYPRYALDFAFLRVYGRDGRPLKTDHFFRWSREGVQEGDAVFVIGNPGPTNRLSTVAQLEFQRDVLVPAQKAFLSSRVDILREYHRSHPSDALMTRILSLSNSLKANTGRLNALRDPALLARKIAGERDFQTALERDPNLRDRWGGIIGRLGELQQRKRAVEAEYQAFVRLGAEGTESSLVVRALAAAQWLEARRSDASLDTLAALERRLRALEDLPPELEEALLEARLADILRHLGAAHPVSEAALRGRTPEGAAAALLARSVLSTREKTALALDGGTLSLEDPGMAFGQVLWKAYTHFLSAFQISTSEEQLLAAELGRARFAVYGPDVPPDGSGSPRITDGVVLPYEYNGTLAPVYTTFFGMYDRHYANGPGTDWDLPPRWLPPPAGLDLGTPINFVSTADTYGGNSGSPAVTPSLEIVGINFDRNIDGLSRDFIYLPERGRNIMVDVRAIRQSLEKVYGGHRIVEELATGRMASAGPPPDPTSSRPPTSPAENSLRLLDTPDCEAPPCTPSQEEPWLAAGGGWRLSEQYRDEEPLSVGPATPRGGPALRPPGIPTWRRR